MTTSPDLLASLSGNASEFAEVVGRAQAADVVEALRTLEPEAAGRVIAALPFDLAVQVLDEPELERRSEIIRSMDGAVAGPLIAGMSADQQAVLLRQLHPWERERLLEVLPASAQGALSLLLRFPADTAGGLMTTEYLRVPPNFTVDETLRLIQREGSEKETIYVVYVVDPQDERLTHVVSLRELVLSDRDARVTEIGSGRDLITVEPGRDREEVGRVVSKYDLVALPVVDHAGRMLGIVTVDDALDALAAEQTEDVQKFGGLEALDEAYTRVGFGKMIRKRAGWLTALFVGETLTATAMGRFEHQIERAVVLALFIPLIVSSGGNSGAQATSIVIRAMALGEIGMRDWLRVAAREFPTGLALGAILGVVGAGRIAIWQGLGWYDYGEYSWLIALTIGLALVGVVTFGSLTGSILPFLLRRLGFDPASASAPFVATLVDVTGILIYFTVATVILRGTLL